MFGQVRPRSGLSLSMQINRGEAIDFTNSRLADARRIGPQLDWNATRHLLVRLTLQDQEIERNLALYRGYSGRVLAVARCANGDGLDLEQKCRARELRHIHSRRCWPVRAEVPLARGA
jgi:hypothetical protein